MDDDPYLNKEGHTKTVTVQSCEEKNCSTLVMVSNLPSLNFDPKEPGIMFFTWKSPTQGLILCTQSVQDRRGGHLPKAGQRMEGNRSGPDAWPAEKSQKHLHAHPKNWSIVGMFSAVWYILSYSAWTNGSVIYKRLAPSLSVSAEEFWTPGRLNL